MFMPNVVKYPHDVDKLVVILANPSLSVTASVKVSLLGHYRSHLPLLSI